MAFYQDNLLKRVRKSMKIPVFIVSILAVLVENAAQASNPERFGDYIPDILEYKYRELMNSSIESKELKTVKYIEDGGNFRFYKNLLLSDEESSATPDMIVERTYEKEIYHPNEILMCYYTEKKINDDIKKTPFPYIKELGWPKRSIFIPNIRETDKEDHMKRLEEARRLKEKTAGKETDVEKAIRILVDLIDIRMSRKYINRMKVYASSSIKITNKTYIITYYRYNWVKNLDEVLLSRDIFKYTFVYWAIGLFKSHYRHWEILIRKYAPLIEEILVRNHITEADKMKYICVVKNSSVKEINLIAAQIEEMEKECAEYAEESKKEPSEYAHNLLKKAKKQNAMHIQQLQLKEHLPNKKDSGVPSISLSSSIEEIKIVGSSPDNSLLSQLLCTKDRYCAIKEDTCVSDIIGIIQEENAHIIGMLEIEKKELLRAHFLLYLHRTGDLLKDIKKIVKKEVSYMGMQEYTADLKRISCFLINNFVDIRIDIRPEEKQKVANELHKKVVSQIEKIIKYTIKYAEDAEGLYKSTQYRYNETRNGKEIFRIFMDEKKELVSILLSPLFFDEIDIAEYKDLAIILEIFRKVVEKMVDIMLYKHLERVNYNKYGCLEHMANKKEMLLKIDKDSTHISIKYLLDFLGRFGYNMNPKYNQNEMLFPTIENSSLPTYNLKRWDVSNICRFLTLSYRVYKYIDCMNTIDEVWQNPAVLYLRNLFEHNPSTIMDEIPCYIIFKKQDGSTYVKSIEFTDENLEAFRKAKRILHIIQIPGEEEEIKEFSKRKEFEENRKKEIKNMLYAM